MDFSWEPWPWPGRLRHAIKSLRSGRCRTRCTCYQKGVHLGTSEADSIIKTIVFETNFKGKMLVILAFQRLHVAQVNIKGRESLPFVRGFCLRFSRATEPGIAQIALDPLLCQTDKKVLQTILVSLYTPLPLRQCPHGNNTFQRGASLIFLTNTQHLRWKQLRRVAFSGRL